MTATDLAPLTAPELAHWRERFIGHRARLQQDLERVNAMLAHLDRLCLHDMQSRGHTGPYERFVCTRCGAEDFVL